jgi:glycerol-3-phosphate dehydrogenase
MGTAVARELSRYQLNVLVLEQGPDVCCGSSKATSAIVHSCFHEKPGTLKAILGVKGNAMFPSLCKLLDVPFNRIGSLLIASNEDDLKILEFKKEQGEKNGISGLKIIGQKELFAMEPNISSEAIGALYAPTGGIVSPYELAIALMENAQENGVKLETDSPVKSIKWDKDGWLIETTKARIESKYVINSAGFNADTIAAMAGDDSFKVIPYKGEEYLLDRNKGNLVKHVIETASLGVIAVPTPHGNIMLGTTRIETTKHDFDTTLQGLEHIIGNVKKILPTISKKDIITSFAGLRSINNITEDFIIGASEKADNFINVSIGSPGVYATPAIAEMVMNILREMGAVLKEKAEFKSDRKGIVDFKTLSSTEKDQLIKKDSRFGHVVCRCETVTEGQIVEAIRRGARTLDGVKYRTRAGMGRCQGGFCTPRVLRIMSRELGVSVTELTKKGGQSIILPYKIKELLEEDNCK